RLYLNRVETVSCCATYALDRSVIDRADLRLPRYSRPDALALLVTLDLVAQLCEDCGLLRTGTDHVHVPAEYVDELRQLVQAIQPQDPAETRHPRIVRLRPHLVIGIAVGRHRAELVDRERLAAAVTAPTISLLLPPSAGAVEA